MDTRTRQKSTAQPRLAPIEEPEHWLVRLAYWFSRRQLGKVITPMKVIYARIPESLQHARAMQQLEQKGLSLGEELKFQIKTHVAQLNGCSFCVDIAEANARQRDAATGKVRSLHEYRGSPAFSERERAALAYVEEATLEKHVTDATFEQLAQYFSEREIAEITWLNAMENYYNLLNLPLNIGSDGLCEIGEEAGHSEGK